VTGSPSRLAHATFEDSMQQQGSGYRPAGSSNYPSSTGGAQYQGGSTVSPYSSSPPAGGGYGAGGSSGGAYSSNNTGYSAAGAARTTTSSYSSGGAAPSGSHGGASATAQVSGYRPPSGGSGTYTSPSPQGTSYGQQQQQSSAWLLEPINYQGATYLLDRSTGSVYKDVSEHEWPQLVGRMGRDGQISLLTQNTASG
jgi:hypothetical protein